MIKETETQTKSALSGIKIVDMTSVLFGPYASQTLADYGAEIIKVEAPEGIQPATPAPFMSKDCQPYFWVLIATRKAFVSISRIPKPYQRC